MQTAFRFEPPAAGTLRSENNNKTFAFEPNFRFAFGTHYLITIDSTARDILGRSLDGNRDGIGGDAFVSRFTTIPLTIARPIIVNYKPPKSQTGVFLREVIEVLFNRPVDPATVGPQSILIAAGIRRVNVRIFASTENGLHRLSLVPTQNFLNGIVYNVILSKAIKDLAGTPMPVDFRWSFTTTTRAEVWETLSTFSAIDQPFGDPLLNPRTHTLVRDSTQYQLATRLAISDSTAGKLRYQFQPDKKGGTVFFDLRKPIEMDSTDAAAMFVYGDTSKNTLQWHLRARDGTAVRYEQVIDFTNWRNLRLEVSRDSVLVNNQKVAASSLAPLLLEGLALERNGKSSGEIYFEDLAYIHPQRTAVAEPPASTPKNFALEQNFPNPFNPETEIKFYLPRRSPVKIAIVDPLGRLVRVLIDGILEAGEHRTRWNGKNQNDAALASGIYFVKMNSQNFSAVRKLLLVR